MQLIQHLILENLLLAQILFILPLRKLPSTSYDWPAPTAHVTGSGVDLAQYNLGTTNKRKGSQVQLVSLRWCQRAIEKTGSFTNATSLSISKHLMGKLLEGKGEETLLIGSFLLKIARRRCVIKMP